MSSANYYRQITKILSSHGWYLARKSGHEIWKKEGEATILAVPRNLCKKYTANAILKDAGLTKKF